MVRIWLNVLIGLCFFSGAVHAGDLNTTTSIIRTQTDTGAQAATVSLLCGFDSTFGNGPETTFPRQNESRVLIDFKQGSVRFTSPGSGGCLVPNEASISDSYIHWWVGTPDGMQKGSYSIERASNIYTLRHTFGGEVEPRGTRGSCLPKKPF